MIQSVPVMAASSPALSGLNDAKLVRKSRLRWPAPSPITS
jgi:hypothetical protein